LQAGKDTFFNKDGDSQPDYNATARPCLSN